GVTHAQSPGLTIDGHVAATFDDTADTAPASWALQPGSLSWASQGLSALISHQDLDYVGLLGGSGADDFVVTPLPGLSTKVKVEVDGGAQPQGAGDTLTYLGTGTITPASSTDRSSGKITQDGFGIIAYSGIEVPPESPVTPADGPDNGGSGDFLVQREGDDAVVYVNGRRARAVPLTSTAALPPVGLGGPATLTIEGKYGYPIPVGGLIFDGGGGINTVEVKDASDSADATWALTEALPEALTSDQTIERTIDRKDTVGGTNPTSIHLRHVLSA